MRIGKLLEDLDALAGNIAFYHVRNEDNAAALPLIVTASVDRIRLKKTSPTMSSDQVLSGRVTYVGTSSMEIRMHCTTAGESDPWLEAFTTFVTLDPTNTKPIQITPLLPQTPQEQADYDAGAQRAAAKRQRRKAQKGAHPIPPLATALMSQALPILLKMPSLAAGDSIQMSATAMQNALIAQPQVRNLHNRIFGGFLMRRAFELAFANAYVFGGARPVFREVDEISFAAPVDVGDLLVFNSRVLYTSSNTMEGVTSIEHDSKETYPMVHLEVETWVTEPEQANAKLSNQFYFTFAIVGDGDGKSGTQQQSALRRILPANMDEAIRMALRMEADRDQAISD
jgi:acyl-coenzyme A thioesterase 9